MVVVNLCVSIDPRDVLYSIIIFFVCDVATQSRTSVETSNHWGPRGSPGGSIHLRSGTPRVVTHSPQKFTPSTVFVTCTIPECIRFQDNILFFVGSLFYRQICLIYLIFYQTLVFLVFFFYYFLSVVIWVSE